MAFPICAIQCAQTKTFLLDAVTDKDKQFKDYPPDSTQPVPYYPTCNHYKTMTGLTNSLDGKKMTHL